MAAQGHCYLSARGDRGHLGGTAMDRLPIIYVRGYAGATSGIDTQVDDPFYGFNNGATHVRVGGDGDPMFYQFEGPMLRLMIDEQYQLLVHGDQHAFLEDAPPGSLPELRGFRRLLRTIKQVFYEVAGAMFGVLAFAWFNLAFRAWTRDVAYWLIGASLATALLFVFFAVTSFRRARQL